MTSINQKEYLKKYLGIGKVPGEKKKKKKKERTIENRLKIIDDDADVQISREIEEDISAANEDAPQIVAVIDERPLSLQIDEQTNSNLWKPIGEVSDAGETETVKLSTSFKLTKQIKNSSVPQSDLRNTYKRKDGAESWSKTKIRKEVVSSPKRNRSDDMSPSRAQKFIKTEEVLTLRREIEGSSATKNKDHSSSPRRRKWEDNSTLERKNKTDDGSPARRTESDDNSPPRRRIKNDISLVKRRNDDGNSPPRRINRNDHDFSPPRNRDDNSSRRNRGNISTLRRKDEEDNSLSRRRSRDDMSPPRRHTLGDLSPKRRNKEDSSHTKRKNYDVDFSPSRKKPDISPLRKLKHTDEKQKTSRWGDWSPEEFPDRPETSDQKMKTTLDGKKAGLQSAKDLVKETVLLRQKEDQIFKNLPPQLSGKNAVTVIRDKKVKDPEEDAQQLRKEKETKEKYDRWGKGLKQIESHNEKIAEQLHEMSKPLARYADDEDLEKYLKEQEREGDPMLAYIRKKKRKKAVAAGVSEKPMYVGEFMPNRFGIRPGYRWDGVDRFNGYEKRWFQVQNSRKASQEEAFKWSTEDM